MMTSHVVFRRECTIMRRSAFLISKNYEKVRVLVHSLRNTVSMK